ncbi:MAG: hypothetical protein H0W83_11430 [Planctomycetes bacterium]|nr:hypothetical protein [Planctomycetota bacterium]
MTAIILFHAKSWVLALGLLVAAGSLAAAEAATDAAADAKSVFERRIKPIFASPKPTSCLECHLAGVDLKNYIKPSSELTFRSLRDQGLVDVNKPEDSRILALIGMGEGGDGAQKPSLIHSEVRKAEYEGFAEWLRACCADPAMIAAAKLPERELAKPPRPDAVIRHARRDRVLASFEDHVWAQRFRCTGCHAADGDQVAKLVAEQGDRDFLWIRPEGAEATMKYIIAQGLVDTKQPERSLLLRKPALEVKHAGGKKLEIGDQGYKELRAWIEEYSRTVTDGYKTVKDLPPAPTTVHAMTDMWLKITDTPGAWGDKLLQVDIHASDGKGGWAQDPIATSDRAVFSNGNLWQHVLTCVAPVGSEQAKGFANAEKPKLPAGKYLVRVYVDLRRKLEKDWRARLGAEDLVGETVIDASWATGYGSMTTMTAGALKKAR